ncbi:MAG: SDR family NAD(P)-dependent oxidoreductase [Bacteroidales bacterium]|jgi:short-subunit dehydrogenase|nr:SDR family NAD(P)-dependent oxidoreductase [Bacteroidales bacterium]
MKKIIIVGATSGIGREVALLSAQRGWIVGACGRREENLADLQKEIAGLQANANTNAPKVFTKKLDVTADNAEEQLLSLVKEMGGMDVFFQVSGIGKQNPLLDDNIELQTVMTNGIGFTRMVTAAYRYFRHNNGGRIAVLSSIAGTRGLGAAPSYSATKRFQNTYIDALEQLSYMEKAKIRFTDIRPGFVDTPLLSDGKNYPMLMPVDKVARSVVRAIERGKRVKVIDRRYAVLVFFWKLIPRCIWKRIKAR